MNNGVNYAVCQDIQESESICGAFAEHFAEMPYGIPPMPLCKRHYPKYEALGFDGLKDIVDFHLGLMLQEMIDDPEDLKEYLRIMFGEEDDE